MSFTELYDEVQRRQGRISTHWLRDTAISLSQIISVKQQWTGTLDPNFMRGFYIEGPLGPPVPIKERESLIVLARGLDPNWRRLVYAKELMHVFDEPEEKIDTSEKLDAQAEKCADPQADSSPQFRAENKALFRAVSLFCQESRRLEYERALSRNEISLDVISASLRIPAVYARHLFRQDYLAILSHLK
ncbi:MAG TPA: hypothetical protein VGM07_15080 [Stellaceae bacterium]|jgi:hypothetical protein